MPVAIWYAWTDLIRGGAKGTKINYLFIPEESYTDINEFKSDIETKYLPKLFSIQGIDSNENKFNFYYTETKVECDANAELECGTLPETINSECSFADVKAVIHKKDFRDYNIPGEYFTANEPITQVHELGHALFRLADEYCCDSNYAFRSRINYPNVFDAQGECQKQLDDNSISKRCKKICKDVDQGEPPCGDTCECVNFYRQEGMSIMNDEYIYEKFSENNLLQINFVFSLFG